MKINIKKVAFHVTKGKKTKNKKKLKDIKEDARKLYRKWVGSVIKGK